MVVVVDSTVFLPFSPFRRALSRRACVCVCECVPYTHQCVPRAFFPFLVARTTHSQPKHTTKWSKPLKTYYVILHYIKKWKRNNNNNSNRIAIPNLQPLLYHLSLHSVRFEFIFIYFSFLPFEQGKMPCAFAYPFRFVWLRTYVETRVLLIRNSSKS